MASLKDVMVVVKERGRVSIAEIADIFSLPMDKACRVAMMLMEKGLILPMETAYLAPPDDEGLPPKFTRATDSAWVRQHAAVVLEFLGTRPELGASMTDLIKDLEIGRGSIRQALGHLVDTGSLMERESTRGGMFGNRPKLYGFSEEALLARELMYPEKKTRSPRKPSESDTPPKSIHPPKGSKSNKPSSGKLIVDFNVDE